MSGVLTTGEDDDKGTAAPAPPTDPSMDLFGAWRKSAERFSAVRRLSYLVIVSVGLVALAAGVIYFISSNRVQNVSKATDYDFSAIQVEQQRWHTIWVIFDILIVVLSLLVYVFCVTSITEKRRQFENNYLLSQAAAQDRSPSSEWDFETLWTNNRNQLQVYHQIVLNFAASSRQYTQISLLIGFVFIVIISIFAITANATANAISSSVVASAGAIVTGFIAQTTLKNSAASSRELIEFFSHPIEEQRVLAAERLIQTMPADRQADAKLLVVEHMMNGAAKRPSQKKKVARSKTTAADKQEAQESD
jgi:hypothetical protein